MKNIVTDLNYPNEMVMFSRSILGNFYFYTLFEELEDKLYPPTNSDKQSELFHSNHIVELNCTLLDHINDASIGSSHCTLVNSSFTNHCTQLTNHNLWTLYFDTSRNTHGVDVGCLLVDLYGIWTYFSFHLESKCTNNDAKYESLIQGIRKQNWFKGQRYRGIWWLSVSHQIGEKFHVLYFLSPQKLPPRGMEFEKWVWII